MQMKESKYSTNTIVENLLDSIVARTQNYLHEDIGFMKIDVLTIEENSNFVIDYDFVCFIETVGICNIVCAFGINFDCAKELAKLFLMEDISPDEEDELIPNCISEAFNIILGNSLNEFDSDDINITTPLFLFNYDIFKLYHNRETIKVDFAIDNYIASIYIFYSKD